VNAGRAGGLLVIAVIWTTIAVAFRFTPLGGRLSRALGRAAAAFLAHRHPRWDDTDQLPAMGRALNRRNR
jgi:hypothetical protein